VGAGLRGLGGEVYACGGTRTPDAKFRRLALYPLSYAGGQAGIRAKPSVAHYFFPVKRLRGSWSSCSHAKPPCT
jgi:hypothetical protein